MDATQERDPTPEAAQQRERYQELLAELRTVLPGVQVLFAFLLTAPFSGRFSELDRVGRDGYVVALASAALSTVLFLAPTSYHRVAPRRNRAMRLRIGVVLIVAGMMALAVAICAALFVVTRFIFGTGEGTAMALAALGCIVVSWYLLPLLDRLRTDDDDP